MTVGVFLVVIQVQAADLGIRRITAQQMTPEIALTLLIILGALILFATEKLRVDVVALLVLISVGVLGLIPAKELFSGFSNSAVITVWAVYMVSGGLFKTGVANAMGTAILKIAGNTESRLIATIMLTVGVLSAFMNNVGATAMLLPAVVGISRVTKVAVSKLLIPLAFASLLGGAMTLIGTPANILATGILAERGLPTFGFFEFAPMGIVVLVTGVLYMVLIGRRLLPVREGALGREEVYNIRDYVTEVRVSPESSLIGKTLLESRLGQDFDLTVLALQRENGKQPRLRRDIVIQIGDLLIVESSASDLMAARQSLGLTVEAEQKFDLGSLERGDVQLIEATLAPRSHIVGRSLRDVRFRDRYGFTALAISRQGEVITERLRDVPLKFGDSLLLQGPPRRVKQLQEGENFLVLEPIETEQFRRNKAPIAVAALVLAIGLAIFAGMAISLAMVIAAVIMILAGALRIEEAYESVDWRTVFLVAGMLPLGLAMELTGTARLLADVILEVFEPYGARAALAGIYLLAALITQPMSNAAAIVLIVPIALDTADGLDANYKTFTMAVVIGAATSFLSPVGHKANVLVFGPGGYKFTDYARVGAILTVLLLIVSMIFLPIFWPLFPD
ncbi:MAG: SLC13 family permease [Chloroflexi bacterium]|nr:SLC13 family permease [Chloroflexota bacterium]MCI0806153.1 SLC13 family permease [Chloroflexota bacterium]